jgi:hypothetical protein
MISRDTYTYYKETQAADLSYQVFTPGIDLDHGGIIEEETSFDAKYAVS